MNAGRRRPQNIPPAKAGPDAEQEIAEAENFNSRTRRIQNQRLDPDDEAQTERKRLAALDRSRGDGKSLADRRQKNLFQGGKARHLAKPCCQRFKLHGGNAVFARLRPQPIREQPRRRSQGISVGEAAEGNPVEPRVEIPLQGGRSKFCGHPLDMKIHVGRSRGLREELGATAHHTVQGASGSLQRRRQQN